MPTIYFGLEPKLIECKVFSDTDAFDAEGLVHRRCISFKGDLKASGIYQHSSIHLVRGDETVDFPKWYSIVVREVDEPPNQIGELSYAEALRDAELGIDDPTQISVEIEYGPDEFKKLLGLIKDSSLGRLVIQMAVEASGTDPSGYSAGLNVSGDPIFPIKAAYFSRRLDITNQSSRPL